MIDSGSDFDKEAVSEIKGTLDREVARRFDGDRFAIDHIRLVELSRTGRSVLGEHADIARMDSARGPFSRVPAPLQWLGLAAALIAAAAGIRSVYRDWTEPQPAVIQAKSSAAAAVTPERPSPDEASRAPAVGSATDPIAPPTRAPHRERERAPEPPPRIEEPPRIASAIDAPPPPAPQPSATSPRDSISAGIEANVATEGERAGTAGAAPPPPPAARTGALVATGALPSGVDLRVASERLFQQGLRAAVHAAPELQATIVMIDSLRGRPAPKDAATSRDPSVLAQQSRGEDAGGPNRPSSETGSGRGGSTHDDQHATASETDLEPSGDTRDRAPGSDGAQGAYYVRAFIGSAFDVLSQDNSGYLGEATEAIVLRAHEAWGDPKQEEALRGIFRLRSVVAIDGVHLRRAASGASEGKLSVAAARRVYAIAVKGDLVEGTSTEHTVNVRLTRRFPDGRGPASTRSMEIPLVVRNGAIAILCVPDPLFSGARDWEGRGPQNILFVVVSPRFSDLAPAARPKTTPRGGLWNDPVVVVDRIEPLYPEDARALGVRGKVVLEATVLSNGDVDGVHVISIPAQYGAEMLIEPASSVVRRWRFLPARIHGESIDAVVRVTIEFRP